MPSMIDNDLPSLAFTVRFIRRGRETFKIYALLPIYLYSSCSRQGNEIDWSLTSYPELSLEGIEFVALPSGLHAINQDVIYFSRQGHHGVCVFQKRETSDEGLRGARLGALGVLLVKSSVPMPWLHVKALKDLSDTIDVTSNSICPPPIHQFFEANKSSLPVMAELSSPPIFERLAMSQDPVHSFPEFLAIFGPSAFTIMRSVLAGKRVIVYTHPSTEAACLYAMAATQVCAVSVSGTSRQTASYEFIGVVTLFDIDRLAQKSKQNLGWIACTTDRLFLEKPHLYDLVVDLSTPPSPPSRPTLFISVPTNNSSRSAPTHRLKQVHPTLSELRAWSQIKALLSSRYASEVVELFRSVPVDWFEAFWMTLVELWSAISPAQGIQLTGSDDLETRDVTAPPEPEGLARQEENTSPLHSPTSAHLLLDRGADGESSAVSRRIILNIVEMIQHHVALFDARASSYSPTSEDDGRSRSVELFPRDISSFGLNPFSPGDVEFCQTLVMANLRRRGLLGDVGESVQSTIDVQVKRPWRDMLAWLLGWDGAVASRHH